MVERAGRPIPAARPLIGEAEIEAAVPETERAAAEVLSLPVHRTLTASELERMAAAANELKVVQ